jgi:ketosteroid isomerase-like protein
MAENDRSRVLRRALEACVLGKVEALPELFTADVSGWSPNMLVTSLDELADVVAFREAALSDVTVQVDALAVVGNKGYMEYRLSAVFSGPFVIDDDTVVDPNGQEVRIGAALVVEFKANKISAFRNYFDDAALLEQLLIA